VSGFGQTATGPTLADRRLAICRTCPNFRPRTARCGLCGCFMQIKARLRGSKCPAGKW